MKNALILILFVLFNYSLIFAQTVLYPNFEIFLRADGTSLTSIKYTMERTNDMCWKFTDTIFNKTNSYSYLEQSIDVPTTDNNYGFYHSISGDVTQNLSFGYGLYHVKIINNSNSSTLFSFYLNYIDSDYTTEYNGENDIWLKYNADSGVCFYSNEQNYNYQSISSQQLLNIWIIKDKVNNDNIQMTNNFENYWSSTLNLLESNNHPRLVWGPHPDFRTTNYKIYRAWSPVQVSDPSTLNTWTLQATVSNTTYDWTDTDVDLSYTNSDYYYYYVKAYYFKTNIYSGPSNYIYVNGQINKTAPPKTQIENEQLNFHLSDNYPNPSTTELYLIPSVDALSLPKC